MTTITNLEQKTFNNKPSGFKVTLSDGRSGNLEEKQSDKGLRVGDEVAVTEIPYTSKAGNKSTLYGLRLMGTTSSVPPQVRPPASTAPYAPPIPAPASDIKKLKSDATISAMKYTVDTYIEGKTPWEKIKETHKELTQYLWDAIDEAFKG